MKKSRRSYLTAFDTVDNPQITSASISGKNLIVTGHGFDQGSVIRVTAMPQTTRNDPDNPTTVLIGKKSAKVIPVGSSVIIVVYTASGKASNLFQFTR